MLKPLYYIIFNHKPSYYIGAFIHKLFPEKAYMDSFFQNRHRMHNRMRYFYINELLKKDSKYHYDFMRTVWSGETGHQMNCMAHIPKGPEHRIAFKRHLEATKRCLPKGLSVCDMGCGGGTLLNSLKLKGKQLGIDINSKSIKWAKKMYPHNEFKHVEKLEDWLSENRKDWVVLLECVLVYFPEFYAIELLKSIRRSEATLIISDTVYHDMNQETSIPIGVRNSHSHPKLLEKSGFEIVYFNKLHACEINSCMFSEDYRKRTARQNDNWEYYVNNYIRAVPK